MLILSIKIDAQLISEEINFNNYTSTTDNDLVNYFTAITPHTYELISDGNNGYYINTSLSGAATNTLKLCSKYRGVDTETMTISFDFKIGYYPTPVSYYYNSVAIFITNEDGLNGFNTRLSEDSYSKTLVIGGLTNPNSTYNPDCGRSITTNNNWYKLEFSISKIAVNKFSVSSKIYDIGIDGKSNPVLKVNNTKEGFNYDFNPTNNFDIKILGAWWGDVKYIDNLKIYGYKNGSNCQIASNTDLNLANEIDLFPNPFTNEIQLKGEIKEINIYNLNGQLISKNSNLNNVLNVENLESGLYLFEVFTNNGVLWKRLIKK